MKYSRVYIILLLILSFFAVRYLLMPGFIPTHDGEFHFIRFWQFEKEILAHDYFPIWAPDLNSGFGMPLFYYHYPMPNYIGMLFHQMGFSYADSFKLVLATFYITGTVFYYLWLSQKFSKVEAFLGTLFFAWTPYWFVNLFVRGSIGEVMASGGLSFALWATSRGRKTFVALGTAFIILSHNIGALLFIPILLMYGWRSSRWSVLLGILISSYFWLPALTGSSYVVGLSNINIADHFTELSQLIIPSWGTGFSRLGAPFDEMSQQLGIGTLLLALYALFHFRKYKKLVITLGILSFMVTSYSLIVWKIVPFLTFVQYPWRLLMFLPFVTGILAATIARKSNRPWILAIIGLIIIFLGFSYTKPVVYTARDDNYYLSRREFIDGTSSLGNSMSTAWTPWKRERANAQFEIIDGQGLIEVKNVSPTHFQVSAQSRAPMTLLINIVYFPGWEIQQSNRWQSLKPDDNGLMRIALPAGRNDLQIKLHNTPVRQVALVVSLAGFIWLLGSAILKR